MEDGQEVKVGAASRVGLWVCCVEQALSAKDSELSCALPPRIALPFPALYFVHVYYKYRVN